MSLVVTRTLDDRKELFMWRYCDLHVHTAPNEQCSDAWNAERWIEDAVSRGLDLVAVTDHDHIDHVPDAVAVAREMEVDLEVIAGVELSTDRGHVLLLGPGAAGLDAIREFIGRIGARPGRQVTFDDVVATLASERSNDEPFGQYLISIGAHVDTDGSLLATNNPLSIAGQLQLARRLHALEVCREEVLGEWLRAGVKQSPQDITLLSGSDRHAVGVGPERGTWLYLPEVTVADFRHALALPESAVLHEAPTKRTPTYAIESLAFTGGHHDGHTFTFCERTNAIIGPPNAGKSLIVDALKFVFDSSCDLDEVESISRSRMSKCLPRGATVEVRVRTPSGTEVVRRTVGGSSATDPPFRPIISSQTELTRRAMAGSPAIALLDVHAPDVGDAKTLLKDLARTFEQQFLEIRPLAEEARRLRTEVDNPEDGLEAIQEELNTLIGAEDVAGRATDVVRVSNWRQGALKVIEEWNAEGVDAPAFLAAPATEQFSELVPKAELESIVDRYQSDVRVRLEQARTELRALLSRDDERLAGLQETLFEELKQAGFEGGSEVTGRLDQLRSRLSHLQEAVAKQREVEAAIDGAISALLDRLTEIERARTALTDLRRDACRRVNGSMRTFFARVDETGVADRLDALIDELKTGTYMRPEARRRLRDRLNRRRVVERAVRTIEGRDPEQTEEDDPDLDRIIEEAIQRDRLADIARLACLWPGDSLSLEMKGSPPTSFSDLTEGLRALAIKEISFAASELPVVTDQPEDAVPTRAVFESLVPTLRTQRASRQFVVVSHDANIVVAGDAERVCVLGGAEDGSPHTGSLFDPVVRSAALEHLEGGQSAFRLRAARYEQLT